MADILFLPDRQKVHRKHHGLHPELAGAAALSEIAACFASRRQDSMNPLWLKENAELLSVLRNVGNVKQLSISGKETVLQPYLPFFEGSLRHLEFFTPYYRFILSICFDLEDLGFGGGPDKCRRGEMLASRVKASGVLEHELSDLQRAETRNLLRRRGVELDGQSPGNAKGDLAGLDDRLRAFLGTPAAFAVPNRRTAYELTHVVFYLSDYGRRDPELPDEARISLEYAGLLAFLDQDADLLSELCLALRFANFPVPDQWVTWLDEQWASCSTSDDSLKELQIDNYHTYLMLNWFISEVVNRKAFGSCCHNLRQFKCLRRDSALRGLTMALYSLDLEGARSRSGQAAQFRARLSERERDLLAQAASSVGCFDRFFEDFLARGYRRSSASLSLSAGGQ